MDRQRPPADEGLLATAGLPVGVASRPMIEDPPTCSPTALYVSVGRSPAARHRDQFGDVVIEEKHPGPAEHAAEEQGHIAFRVGVCPPFEDGGRQQARSLPARQAQVRGIPVRQRAGDGPRQSPGRLVRTGPPTVASPACTPAHGRVRRLRQGRPEGGASAR